MHTGGQRLYQIHNFSQKFLVLAEKHALHVDAVLGAASIRWVHLWSERAITFSPGIQYLSVNLHSLSHKGKIHQKAHTVASLLHVCLAETLYGSGVQSVLIKLWRYRYFARPNCINAHSLLLFCFPLLITTVLVSPSTIRTPRCG